MSAEARAPREATVRGVGLHTGRPACVTLRAEPGPMRLRSGGAEAALADLVVASTERSTTVASASGIRVGMVEHLFAALAGLAVYDGLVIDVDGPELPLLDGGSAAWCEALAMLDLARTAQVPPSPPTRVVREGVVVVESSRYEFAPAGGVHLEVRVELDDDRLEPSAVWTGAPRDFRERIAPARTFARAADIEPLIRSGLARHVEPSSVVVLAPDVVHHAGRPFSADEPARHKLLDLMGDFYVHGGPPIGRVRAVRPGHRANAAAIARAFAEGILERR
jgi:UDP-3-O-[3-hydroxymyristoyl] N-acetylglucosamine deacetylase